jgi:hypothetical protein
MDAGNIVNEVENRNAGSRHELHVTEGTCISKGPFLRYIPSGLCIFTGLRRRLDPSQELRDGLGLGRSELVQLILAHHLDTWKALLRTGEHALEMAYWNPFFPPNARLPV